jgi:membrane protein
LGGIVFVFVLVAVALGWWPLSNKTCGTLAGVVVLMLWLYLGAYIVLLGAEINDEAEKQTARDTTQGPARPLGHRDAAKADTTPLGS